MRRRSLLQLAAALLSARCAPKISVEAAFHEAQQIVFDIIDYQEGETSPVYGKRYYVVVNNNREIETINRQRINFFSDNESTLMDDERIYDITRFGDRWPEEALMVRRALREIFHHYAQLDLTVVSRKTNVPLLSSHRIVPSNMHDVPLGPAHLGRWISNVSIFSNPDFPNMHRPASGLFQKTLPPLPNWLDDPQSPVATAAMVPAP